MEVSGQLYDLAALSPGVITRSAFCMRLGGRQNLPGRFGVEKILFPLPGNETISRFSIT